MSYLVKRVVALEKEMAKKRHEETILEMQKDLLVLKNQQIEQHNILSDNLQQSEVIQQMMVV